MCFTTPSRDEQWVTNLPESQWKIGRALASDNLSALARAVSKHDELFQLVSSLIFKKMEEECAHLCKRSLPSLFQKIPLSQLECFNWDNCISELQEKAPLLLNLLTSIVSHTDYLNKTKNSFFHYPGIAMAVAIMLKERNREMCGIQSSYHYYSSNQELKKWSVS